MHPRVDAVLCFQRSKGLAGFWQVSRQLRGLHFDLTLDLQRHLKSGFFSLLSGALLRVGFNARDTKEGNHFFNNRHIPPFGEGRAKLLHYLLFSEFLGCGSAEDLYRNGVSFGYSDHPPESLLSEELLSRLKGIGRPMIGLGLGSTWKTKDWPEQGYVELLQELKSAYVPLLLGDRSQVDLAKRLYAQCPEAIDLSGSLTLKELLGVLKLLAGYVGPDSGPVHMASACGVPCVTLFGPTDPKRVAPYRNEQYCMQAELGCIGCYRKVCPGLGTLCMKLIDPRQVYRQIESAMRGRKI